ncbi:MAG: DUF3365 domain-containing protein [Saprospiraceae bacterium]
MQKKLIISILSGFLILVLINSCQNETANKATTELSDVHKEGLNLMIQNCYSCHNPETTEEKRLAPPMIAVKRHYTEETNSKAEFIAAFSKFMENPTRENSKMPNAIKRFGVMPNLSFPKEKVQLIADYLYDNEIESPEWFEEHYNKEHAKENTPYESGDYASQGMHYALTTKGVLGKNLMGTIKAKGTESAISFCNTRAYPLTDSMAIFHDVIIKRVSDKPRNTKNQANETELAHIETFKNTLISGEEIKPIIEEKGKAIRFYAPIKTNEMCLQCHGKKENLAKRVNTKLANLYPNDKATGYEINEIRGIWSIEFPKE